MNLEPDEATAHLLAAATAQSRMQARAASIHWLLLVVVALMNIAVMAQLLPRPFPALIAVGALVCIFIAAMIRSRTRGMNALLAPRGQHVFGRIALIVVAIGAPAAAAILFSLGSPGWLLPVAAVISIAAAAMAHRVWAPRPQPVSAGR